MCDNDSRGGIEMMYYVVGFRFGGDPINRWYVTLEKALKGTEGKLEGREILHVVEVTKVSYVTQTKTEIAEKAIL